MPLSPRHSYRSLPDCLFHSVTPTPVRAPQLQLWNAALAEALQLPAAIKTQAGAIFSGNQLPDWMVPTAQAYSGHQFGQLSARLGDGRAILLCELQGCDQQWYDLQLKGAGPTPYSRRGDGRAALGPALREYLISEWMAAAGVPTSRALALVQTGELVFRQMALPGAVLCRVASSHLRIGSLQYAAMFGSPDELKQLADYAIARHYPQLAERENPYLALLEAVAGAQASLIAHWMSLGFVHGVMNTDNMTLSGETIDYGPCAFVDQFSFEACFSSIDEGGRYAYKNQPAIAQWNLARLAEALLGLIHPDEQQAIALVMPVLNAFVSQYQQARLQAFAAKLGFTHPQESDQALIDDLLNQLASARLDFTSSFFQLPDWLLTPDSAPAPLLAVVRALQQRLTQHCTTAALADTELQLAGQRMRRHNPAFIPRNHQMERIIAAAYAGDFTAAEQFIAALSDIHQLHAEFSQLPGDDFACYRTFCGT